MLWRNYINVTCVKRFSLWILILQNICGDMLVRNLTSAESLRRLFHKIVILQYTKGHTLGRNHMNAVTGTKLSYEKYSLILYLKIHTGEIPYWYSLCDRVFWNTSNPKIHVSDYTGENPYKCDQCIKAFSCKSNLVRCSRTQTS